MLASLKQDGVDDVILEGHPQKQFDLAGAYRHVVVRLPVAQMRSASKPYHSPFKQMVKKQVLACCDFLHLTRVVPSFLVVLQYEILFVLGSLSR